MDSGGQRFDSGPVADSGSPADSGMSPADSGTPDDSGMTPADSGMMADSGTGTCTNVPDPGNLPGVDWTDVEPNDTPCTATPEPMLAGPVWMGTAMPYTMIDSNTDVDFYSFRTSDMASLANDSIQVCWGFAGHLLDLFLYRVDNGMQGPMVASATAATGQCQTVVPAGMGTTLLLPTQRYLLEVRPAPGLNLGGMPGMYGA
jgi:hypothetical protein